MGSIKDPDQLLQYYKEEKGPMFFVICLSIAYAFFALFTLFCACTFIF